MMEEKQEKTRALDRYLSRFDVWSMAFGIMVGWGVFAMPGNTFLPVAGPAGTMIAMAIGMVIMLIIGSNFSYLMGRTAITGGIYSYTKEAFGRDHAFLSSWFLCLSYLTIVFLNGTALFYIVRMLFGNTLQTGLHYTIAGNVIYPLEALVSALVLGVVGLLFIVAKPLLQRLHTILAVLLFAGIVFMTVVCLPHAVANGALTSFGSGGTGKGYAVFSLVTLAPWAFVGFEATSFDTAHFRFPIRKTKPMIILSIIAAALAYTSMTLISVASVPDGFGSWQAYISNLDSLSGVAGVPTFYVAEHYLGTAGLVIMTVTAISSILTGIIGGYRATTRVLSTMAEDKILSERFSKTSYSIIFIMVISIVISFLGRNTLNWFIDLTSFGAIVGFGYTSASAWKIAKTEGDTVRVVYGIIGTVISVLFVIVQLIPRLTAMEAMGSESFLLLSLWCLAGFVFYWRTVRNSSLTEYSGISTSGIVLFALLIYASLMWLAKRLMACESMEEMKSVLIWGGAILIIIIFIGLTVMLYVQNYVRKKHEAAEREKIRAVEGSLAKSQFLFNMSHDIRTPMNAIVGTVDLLLDQDLSEYVRDNVYNILNSCNALLSITNDLVDVSNSENSDVVIISSQYDISELLNEIINMMSVRLMENDVALFVEIDRKSTRLNSSH